MWYSVCACMGYCIMGTKTISIDMEAYEILTNARREERESFSRVIKRAIFPNTEKTAAAYLAALSKLPVVDEDSLAAWDSLKDPAPTDPWEDDQA